MDNDESVRCWRIEKKNWYEKQSKFLPGSFHVVQCSLFFIQASGRLDHIAAVWNIQFDWLAIETSKKRKLENVTF